MFPAVQELCLTIAPYKRFPVVGKHYVNVLQLKFYRGVLDAHCIECGQVATFTCASPALRHADKPVSIDEMQHKTCRRTGHRKWCRDQQRRGRSSLLTWSHW